MIQQQLTDEEKFEMYFKRTTHEELARMHIELEKHIPKPELYIPACRPSLWRKLFEKKQPNGCAISCH